MWTSKLNKFKLFFANSKVDNVAHCVNIFQFFGFYLVDIKATKFQSKFEKFLAYFAYIYFMFKMIVCLRILTGFAATLYGFIPRQHYMEIALLSVFSVAAVLTFLVDYFYRANDRKFWKLFHQTENLNSVFLRVPRISRKFFFFKLFLTWHLGFILIFNIVRFLTDTSLIFQTFGTNAHSVRFILYHLQICWIKYIFYIQSLSYQLDMVLACGDHSEENFLVVQRVMTNIWKMTRQIENIFGIQMILLICMILFMIIFTEYYLILNVISNQSVLYPIGYFGIIFFALGLVSLNCSMCVDKVSQ